MGLTAVEWLPAARHVPWLERGMKSSLGAGARYHVYALNLLQLISPRALGGAADFAGFGNRWETLLAPGWVALTLAVVAVAGWRRRRDVQGWTVLAIGALVIAAGRPLGIFALLAPIVPGMDLFRVPSRALFLVCLATAVLAALGLERLRRLGPRAWIAHERNYRRVVLVLASALLAGAVAAWWLGVDPGLPERVYDAAGRVRGPSIVTRVLIGCATIVREPLVWITLAGVGGLLVWGRNRPRDRARVSAALGVLALIELLTYAVRDLPVTPASRLLDPGPIAAELERQAPVRPFRVRARDAAYADLPAVLGGIEKTNLDDLFQLQHAADVYEPLYRLFGPGPLASTASHRALRRAALERLNVAFVVSDQAVSELDWPVTSALKWKGTTFRIYCDPAPLPRAYVVPRAEIAPDDARIVERFPTLSPRAAVLMAVDPLATVDGPRQSFLPATYDAADPDRVVIRVTTTAPGLLVVADTWMPGWSATVDGHAVAISRGNRAQRVVVLDRPGPHVVVMRYEPPGLVTGAAITGLTALVWVALGIRAWCFRPVSQGSSASRIAGMSRAPWSTRRTSIPLSVGR